MARLTPDSDTLILFDFEERLSSSIPAVVFDTSGQGNNLVVTGTLYHVSGPASSIPSVRALESQTMQHYGVTDAFLTASRGDCTLEAWVFPTVGHGNEEFFRGPHGAGESLSTDYTFRWTLGTDNLWDYFSEHSGGTDVNIAQTTGGLTSGQWNHVALVRRLSGSNIACDFYTNGTLDETVTAAGSLPGTLAGTDLPDILSTWDGAVASIRFSNTVRSGSEILASANRSTRDHVVDANTIGYWACTEAPEFLNRGSTGIHATVVVETVYKSVALVADTTGSLTWTTARVQTSNVYSDDIATQLTGSSGYTVDFWFRFWDPGLVDQRFYVWLETGESLGTNILSSVELNSSNKFEWFGEYDLGQNVGDGLPSYTTTASFDLINRNRANYLALVQKDVGVDQIALDWYLNGQLLETSSGSSILTKPNGGFDGRLFLGGTDTESSRTTMQQFRITKRTLTPSEILTNYQNGTTSSQTGTPVVEVFRGISGSNFVYFTSEEAQPAGLTNITKIGEGT